MKKTILLIIAYMLLCNTALSKELYNLQAQQTKVNNIKKTQQGKLILATADKYSKQYKVDPALVKAIILVESGFNPKACSAHGAKGLMQMMDVTFYARKVGNNPYSIDHNVHAGVKHIAGLHAKYKGNTSYIIASYNCGCGNLDSSLRRYGTVPKYTKGYIDKVHYYKKNLVF